MQTSAPPKIFLLQTPFPSEVSNIRSQIRFNLFGHQRHRWRTKLRAEMPLDPRLAVSYDEDDIECFRSTAVWAHELIDLGVDELQCHNFRANHESGGLKDDEKKQIIRACMRALRDHGARRRYRPAANERLGHLHE